MNVLLFDIDGTLIDAGGAGQAAMEASMASEFGANPPVTGISVAGRTDRAIAMDLFRFHQIEVNEDHWRRYLSSYFRLLPGSLQTHRGSILPGIENLLDTLCGRTDVMAGLLTGNFAEGAHLKLLHYGLSSHFDFGGFGDEHVDRDDVARDAIHMVRSRLPEVDLNKVWVIGDTPSDIRCSRAIGAKVLAVGTGIFSVGELQQHNPDAVLKDLSDAGTVMNSLGLS